MKQKKESSGVSISNIITIIGLIAFGVLTYLGQLYLNEGDITSSLLWAIGLTVIAGALSFGTAALKGRKVDAKLMIIVQMVLLVIYIGFAILSSRGALKFFDVQSDKENLKEVALADIARIDSLFGYYERAETKFLNNTQTSFDNALEHRVGCDNDVNNLLNTLLVTNKDQADQFMANSKSRILGNTYLSAKDSVQHNYITPCKNAIRTWDVLKVPMIPGNLNSACRGAKATIDLYTTQAQLPVFETVTQTHEDPETHARTTKVVTTLKVNTQTFNQNAPQLKFGSIVKQSPKVTILGVFVLVLIHLMILLTYITASSNGISYGGSSKNRNDDGGISL